MTPHTQTPATQPSTMRAEDLQFIQLCLRAHTDGEARARLGAGAATVGVDWDRVQKESAAQRLGPLIYQVVRDRGLVPESFERALRESYYATANRNLIQWHEIGLVLQALHAAGIHPIVLKGAALVETVYGNLALRPMMDVDLLVHQEDMRAVVKTICALGYAPQFTEMRSGTVVTYENEILLCKADRADFDIHWSLFDSPFHQQSLEMNWFWDTARPLRIDATSTRMLGPAATLLHLCGHVWLHHGGAALLWLHDVAQAIACAPSPLDWDEVLRRTQACHLVLPVQQVLQRVAADWGSPIPAAVLRQLRSLQPSAEEVRAFNWLSAGPHPVAQRLWGDLRSMQGWGRRLQFVSTLLFPSPAYMRQRYRIPHPLLLPFYYAYRWVRGLRSAL